MHDGIGDGGDVVPAKWRNKEREVGWSAGGGEERENKVIVVGGWKTEGPVEV